MKIVVRLALAICALQWLVAAPVQAAACAAGTSSFTDVQDSAIYCSNTQWLKNRAVTTGCTGTTYCPNDAVTRAAMALFLNRLGTALTPQVIFQESAITAFDPAVSGKHVCQTADVTISDFPRTLMLNSSVSMQVDAYVRMLSTIHISYDSGTSWASIPDASTSVAHRNQGTNANDWMDIPNGATVDIDVGQKFRLGVLVAHDNLTPPAVGTGTIIAGRCKLNGLMLNRNSATAPF